MSNKKETKEDQKVQSESEINAVKELVSDIKKSSLKIDELTNKEVKLKEEDLYEDDEIESTGYLGPHCTGTFSDGHRDFELPLGYLKSLHETGGVAILNGGFSMKEPNNVNEQRKKESRIRKIKKKERKIVCIECEFNTSYLKKCACDNCLNLICSHCILSTKLKFTCRLCKGTICKKCRPAFEKKECCSDYCSKRWEYLKNKEDTSDL